MDEKSTCMSEKYLSKTNVLLSLTYNNIESFVNFEQQPKVDIASS